MPPTEIKLKTLVIIGAGPGVGASAARRFGRAGFKVGLIARTQERLDAAVEELALEQVDAIGAAADVTDRPSLIDAIARIERRFGPTDVLCYQPTPARASLAALQELTAQNVQHQIDYTLLGAVEAVRSVLPAMIARGDGAILFTAGLAAKEPFPSHASAGLAQAALRNYGIVLNRGLAEHGVYAGVVLIAGAVRRSATESYILAGGGRPGIANYLVDPDEVAQLYWDMATRRDRVEGLVGDVAGVTANIT